MSTNFVRFAIERVCFSITARTASFPPLFSTITAAFIPVVNIGKIFSNLKMRKDMMKIIIVFHHNEIVSKARIEVITFLL